MKHFRSAAQQYLADKGCKSNGQKYTAFEIVTMLNEFAQEVVENFSIPNDVRGNEQFYCFNKQNKKTDKCMKQCSTCKGMKLMQLK